MQVRLLGTLEAVADGQAVSLGGPKQRLVLAALALGHGRVVTTDELIEAGWGDDLPANPANTVQYQVAQLRKVIEPEPSEPRYLLTSKPGYTLHDETVVTDARQFEELTAAGRARLDAGDTEGASALIDDALALWRGPALAEFRHLDFARAEAERLESKRVDALELQIDIALADGHHGEVVAELGRLTSDHPLREGLWARLVLALYRTGRRSEALRTFQEARDALAEIGLDPGPGLTDLEQQVLQDHESLAPPSVEAAVANNLPAEPNRLIGRNDDVRAVELLLDRSRLVTLMGPGGAGKTRLSIAVGHGLRHRYPAGVWFVPLDGLDDPELLAAEVGRITGMRERVDSTVMETLAHHLGNGPALLILDNCEHLIEAVADFVHELVAACGELSVLATSQATLETVGEAVFAVRPLALPGETASIYDPIAEVDAATLFIERARDAGADVARWGDGDLAAVANIVSALDGLPLAVELAAARTRSMSLEEIASGLSDRFATLSRGPRTAPERQRSLAGAVEWSLHLLDDRQRSLMKSLSVLVGRFDVEAAAAVSDLSITSARDDLDDLVKRSLLRRQADVGGVAQFGMLESLRQYGIGLFDAEELARTRDSHLAHFAAVAAEANQGMRGAQQVRWLHRLDAAYDNIRAALEWSLLDGSFATGVRLLADIGRYWDWRGLLKEGTAWTDRFVAETTTPVPGSVSMIAWRSFIAWEYGDLGGARQASDLAQEAAGYSKDPLDIAVAMSTAILTSRAAGEIAAAQSQAVRLADAAEAGGDPWMVAWADSALTTVMLAAGDLAAAEEYAHRSVARFDELGDQRGRCWGQISLAQIELDRSNPIGAQQLARSVLPAAMETEDDRNVLWALEVLVEAARQQGELERAARLWGAAKPLRESRGIAGSVSKLSEPSGIAERLADELGDRFAALVREGGSDPAAAIALERNAL